MMRYLLILTLILSPLVLSSLEPAKVSVGIENLFTPEYSELLSGKKIGILTNHTAVNHKMQSTVNVLKANAKKYGYKLTALFAPEHGITGSAHASEYIEDEKDPDGIPIYSLHGKTRRPTPQMLKNVDLVIFDIQDVGSRSYTYVSTLMYMIEEAAKLKIPVMILDRPNPINGTVVDGPVLEDNYRSIVGYINVPYCHGMTIGELAKYFNAENKINCNIIVIPMKGWKRTMSFHETGLAWIPTSPNIPEPTTAFYYPMTGLLGELQIVNIGIGYTLPFKLIGAPWINAKQFADKLNAQKFPGVFFEPFYYKPFYGRFAQEECQGVFIVVTNHLKYKPVATQYLIIGILKGLYPEKFREAIAASTSRKEMFCKVNGNSEIYRIITEENNIVWKLRAFQEKERNEFLELRKKYLIPEYGS